MTLMNEFEQDLLESLEYAFQSMDLNTNFIDARQGMSRSLRVVVTKVGKIEQNILFELYFTYNIGEDAEHPFSLLNMCATIFTEIPPENMDELNKACMYLNPYLPIGTLGTLREQGMLYMQYNAFLRHSYPPEATIGLAVDSFMAMSSSLAPITDGLAVIARGMGDLKEVIDKGLF